MRAIDKSFGLGRLGGRVCAGLVAVALFWGCSEDEPAETPPPVNPDIPDMAGAPGVKLDAAPGGQLPVDAAPGVDVPRADGSTTTADAASTPGVDAGSPTDPTTGDAGAPADATIIADGPPSSGACPFREENHAQLPPPHVPSIDGMTYSSNPPSSGPHCSIWGAWTYYQPPMHLPRCNYIHNLEHGGIVILFKDPAMHAQLQPWISGILARLTQDPDCPTPRLVVTADPLIDTPIAAVAWGSTFKVDCASPEAADALVDYAQRHWGGRGLAPENKTCTNGTASGVPF